MLKYYTPRNVVLSAAQDFKPILWILSHLPYKSDVVHQSRDSWEKQYDSGEWDYLSDLDEAGRHSIVTGYYSILKPGGRILEIGCGDGTLSRRLRPYNYGRYMGIDLSQEAITRATAYKDDKTSYIAADATKYSIDQKFDVVIFNEVLQHFLDPLDTVNRYEHNLEDDGIFIVSMYVGKTSLGIWPSLERKYDLKDEVTVYNKNGSSWLIKVFKSHSLGF